VHNSLASHLLFRPSSARNTSEDFPMRTAGLALALLASTQLTLLSSPAFADGGASVDASASVSVSTSTGTTTTTTTTTTDQSDKKRTGWIILGVGAAVGTAGMIVDIVGGFAGHVSGEGGPGDNGQSSNARTNLVFAGTTMIVAGVIGMIYGGSMVYNAAHGLDQKNSAPPKDEDASSDGATKAAEARLTAAPAVSIPILGARF
jgi:hypothetical protein